MRSIPVYIGLRAENTHAHKHRHLLQALTISLSSSVFLSLFLISVESLSRCRLLMTDSIGLLPFHYHDIWLVTGSGQMGRGFWASPLKYCAIRENPASQGWTRLISQLCPHPVVLGLLGGITAEIVSHPAQRGTFSVFPLKMAFSLGG